MPESSSALDAPVVGRVVVKGTAMPYWTGMTMREILVLGEKPPAVALAQFRYAWRNRDVL